MNVNYYVNLFLESIDKFIRENLNVLTGKNLSDFYITLFNNLKNKYFGGSWGFNGVTEFLILRILYYIGSEKYGKPQVNKITRDIKGFYYPNPNIVLSAGKPLCLGNTKKWLDIAVYTQSSKDDIGKIKNLISSIEVKACPPGGLKGKGGIIETIERLKKIHEHYPKAKLALIIYYYSANESRSKVWRYLLRKPVDDVEPIPNYIDILVLSKIDEKIKNILGKYI